LAKTFSELLKILFWAPKITESDFVGRFPRPERFCDLELDEDSLRAQLEAIHLELTPMIRRPGSNLAIVLFVCTAPQALGQTVAAVNSRRPLASAAPPAFANGNPLNQIEPYGGFGLETMQTPVLGTVFVDRFGMLHETSFARPAPPVTSPRPRAKTNRYAPGGRLARARHQLPTGSLDWAGATGSLLYAPGLRYGNYAGPYGNGPYGSIDCGMMYKGMWLGY
jgi:hypothetical protein